MHLSQSYLYLPRLSFAPVASDAVEISNNGYHERVCKIHIVRFFSLMSFIYSIIGLEDVNILLKIRIYSPNRRNAADPTDGFSTDSAPLERHGHDGQDLIYIVLTRWH